MSQTFPAMMWHAVTGEVGLFIKAEDVPEGYIDTHPNNLANVAPAELPNASAALSMPRDEIVKALEEGGIPFKPNASDKKLHNLLVFKVKEVLQAAEIEFDDACTDAKTLLGLLPPSE